MAEGPLVHRYARQLHEVLSGRQARIEFGVKRLMEAHGTFVATVEAVEAFGKQLRIRLEGGRVILVHLMMWGSWRVYRAGEVWDRPVSRARLIIRTTGHEVVAFSAPVVEMFTESELLSDPRWGDPGPDPLRDEYSEHEVVRRLTSDAARAVGEALLDQGVMAGIGNILRIEALFSAGIDPRRAAGSLTKPELGRLVHLLATFSRQWLEDDRGDTPWISIYQRKGKLCPRCGTPITSFRQSGRITFACPSCQR